MITAEETTNNFDENEQRIYQEIKNQELEAIRAEETRKEAERQADAPVAVSQPTAAPRATPAQPQQRVIEATATSSSCGSNKCSYNGKCYVLPNNASCSAASAGEAWTCRAGYVEYGGSCITKTEYDKKKKAQAVPKVTKPAKHGIVSQRYFNPYNDGYGNGRA